MNRHSTVIEGLLPTQEELISVYQKKWKDVALSVERINRKRAIRAVNQVYQSLGLPSPHVDFFPDPHRVFDAFALDQLMASQQNGLQHYLGKPLRSLMHKKLWQGLHKQIHRQLPSQILSQLTTQLLPPLPTQLPWDMVEECYPLTLYYVSSNWWAYTGSFFDFSISVLNCHYSAPHWDAYQAFAQDCGWIYPFETTAFICDRPTHLSLNEHGQLHGEGKPAIQFLGQFGVFAHHGQILPGLP